MRVIADREKAEAEPLEALLARNIVSRKDIITTVALTFGCWLMYKVFVIISY